MDFTSDDFDCKICFERFKETGDLAPHSLPCGHTYCMGCLRLFDRVCPECKQPILGACPRNLFIVGLISKIDPPAIELDRDAMEVDQEEVEDMDDTSAPTTITYYIHEMYSQPMVVLHHALRALNIPFEAKILSLLSIPSENLRIEKLVNIFHEHPDKVTINTTRITNGENRVFEDDWTGPPVVGQSYFYEMDDYRKTAVLVEVIQLDPINRSVLIRLPNGGERDSEYAKLFGHLITTDHVEDSLQNNETSTSVPVDTPTMSGMDESSSQIIECYIQDLYSTSIQNLQYKLTGLGIPFEENLRIEKLVNIFHDHPDKITINTTRITNNDNRVFEDDWTGPPIIGQSYFYEMDDYRKTAVLVNVLQLDRINHSVLIRLPNGGERDSEYSKLLSHLVNDDASLNNETSTSIPIDTPTTSEMDESSSHIIECCIQDLYSTSIQNLQCKLTELGIPFEENLRIEKLVNIFHNHPDKIIIYTTRLYDDNRVFEDNWTGPPIIGQSYFYEMDDYRKTAVLVEVIQLDRINHSVLIRLPNGGERDSEYSKLLGRLVPPPSTAY